MLRYISKIYLFSFSVLFSGLYNTCKCNETSVYCTLKNIVASAHLNCVNVMTTSLIEAIVILFMPKPFSETEEQ